jgi:hypothetical protein
MYCLMLFRLGADWCCQEHQDGDCDNRHTVLGFSKKCILHASARQCTDKIFQLSDEVHSSTEPWYSPMVRIRL